MTEWVPVYENQLLQMDEDQRGGFLGVLLAGGLWRFFRESVECRDAVIQYIQNQEEHHRKMTFQEEYRRFLKMYQVAYDENYVWD